MSHLTDAELAEILAGEAPVPSREHLASCRDCRELLEDIQREIALFRSDVENRSRRPAAFWAAQRKAILGSRRLSPFQMRLAAASLFCSAAAILTMASSIARLAPAPTHRDGAGAPMTPPATRTVIPGSALDSDILLAAEASLDGAPPEALAPARVLVSEVLARSAAGTRSAGQ